MNGRSLLFVIPGIFLVCFLVYGIIQFVVQRGMETVERTEYHQPPPPREEIVVDDRLDDKKPAFDPSLVDRRPLAEWRVNLSAAVLKLDVPAVKPGDGANLLMLHPSYKDAIEKAKESHLPILPSVNLFDGKAKQFDDGLYAALDMAYYQGLKDRLRSHVELVRRLFEKVGKDSAAAPFLAAGLELAGIRVDVVDTGAKAAWLRDFQNDEVASKPISFYTWNKALTDCFRFLRFFQHEFAIDHLKVPTALARALAEDAELLADYRKALAFYAKLTNPSSCFSVAELVGAPAPDARRFAQLAKERRMTHATVALLPPSTTRETVLFEKLFPHGLPPNADLMRELIRRIRSGEVDLKPRPESGWYEYQVYALETLLLPEKGAESTKLLLTRRYKKRMLEAFQALITKRREIHARQVASVTKSTGGNHNSTPSPPKGIQPRLRVEPCPSYYLRTARAYAFLANLLEVSIGKEALQSLHGLRAEGKRERNLHAELSWMIDLFYGLYLVSAEDIGLKSELAKDEIADQEKCYQFAASWLSEALQDQDLTADTRVAVPIMADVSRKTVRVWATLGVRLAKLDVEFARPPHVGSRKMPGDWKLLNASRIAPAHFLIPVEEFAEVELPGWKTLTREELRTICDHEKTKDAIITALKMKR